MTAQPATLSQVLRSARATAFTPGEFVGQESLVRAGEVLALARRAEVRPGVRVLDLCCGSAGPGLHVVRSLGCDYLGVDASAEAIEEARRRAGALRLEASFEVASVPPLPDGDRDVVLLLETLLAFRDKESLIRAISNALRRGGRFVCTVEAGAALSDAERAVMPAADTVWPIPLEQLIDLLVSAGLRVQWVGECTQAHAAVVEALVDAYEQAAPPICEAGGSGVLQDLLDSHRLWSRWLRAGRIRKFGLVAEKVAATSSGSSS